MDNLNENPLLDDEDEEVAPVSKSKKYGNPLLDDDEETVSKSSDDSSLPEIGGFELPDLEFDYTPSGPIRVPVMVDQSEDDGRELFINDKDSLFSGAIDADPIFYSPEDKSNLKSPVERFFGISESVAADKDDVDDELDMNDSIESLQKIYEMRSEGASDEDVRASVSRSTFDLDGDLDDEDELQGFRLDEVIAKAIQVGASDIHIIPDDQVAFTVLSDIRRIRDYGIIIPNVTRKLQLDIISHVLEQDFVQDMELDTSYVVKTGPAKGRRLRLSIGKSFGDIFLVFRVIADVIPTPKELGVTGPLLEWFSLPRGAVMLNGSTGTGKSTTMSSLLKEVQLTQPKKIITIEKPIEFVYGTEGKALVVQREVGKDARSFAGALKSALRQAPDIVVVGEVRDREEVDEFLRAAETGHLAISTMHSDSAPATINRIMSLYDGDEQKRILGTLSDVARGFANQLLVKTPDGKGRFAVREVLPVDEEVSKLILHGNVSGLQEYQMRHKITMDHELAKAVAGGFCKLEDARLQSSKPHRFDRLVKEAG
jgi:twitching motility protein PilT